MNTTIIVLIQASLLGSILLFFLVDSIFHSLLYFLLSLFFVVFLAFSTGSEFLSLVIIMVYATAVVILFVFIVMMLEVKDSREFDLPLSFIVYLTTALLYMYYWATERLLITVTDSYVFIWDTMSDAIAYAQVLYNYNFLLVILGGLVLFIGLLGPLALIQKIDKNQHIDLADKIKARSGTTRLFNRADK